MQSYHMGVITKKIYDSPIKLFSLKSLNDLLEITKKSSFGVRDQQTADLLALAVQTELGAGVDIKLEPYSENQTDDMKDQGTLLVHIPASGKGEARYRSWFSGGTLGKQEPKK